MATHVKCEGIEEFRQASDEHKGKSRFVLCSGSLDKEGKSWCPDCVAADPVIQRNLHHIPDNAVFIHCGVGDRAFWKDQKNAFRTEPQLRLKCVPTLLCLGKPQRLEEGQCANDDLVKMLFTDGEDD